MHTSGFPTAPVQRPTTSTTSAADWPARVSLLGDVETAFGARCFRGISRRRRPKNLPRGGGWLFCVRSGPGDGLDYKVEGRSSKLRPIHPIDFAHEPRSDGARPTANDVHDKRRRLASAGFIAGGRRDGVRCKVLPGHIAKAQAPKSAAWRRVAALREVQDVPCPSCSCRN